SGEETQPRPLRRPGLRRFQGGLDGLGTHVKGGAISTPLHLTCKFSLLQSTQEGLQRADVVHRLLDVLRVDVSSSGTAIRRTRWGGTLYPSLLCPALFRLVLTEGAPCAYSS